MYVDCCEASVRQPVLTPSLNAQHTLVLVNAISWAPRTPLCTGAYDAIAECEAFNTGVPLTSRDPAMAQEALEAPRQYRNSLLSIICALW